MYILFWGLYKDTTKTFTKQLSKKKSARAAGKQKKEGNRFDALSYHFVQEQLFRKYANQISVAKGIVDLYIGIKFSQYLNTSLME